MGLRLPAPRAATGAWDNARIRDVCGGGDARNCTHVCTAAELGINCSLLLRDFPGCRGHGAMILRGVTFTGNWVKSQENSLYMFSNFL